MSPEGIAYAGISDEAGPGLDEQLAAIAELGWSRIELRSVDGVAIADLDDRAFDTLAGRVGDAGLTVPCLDSRIANWGRPITGRFDEDLDELTVLIDRCARLGTPNIRIMSYPNAGLDEPEWGRRAIERIKVLAERAAGAGLVLLHENCAGWARHRAARMRRLVEEVDSPALRLLFDTGNGVAYGYDAYDLLSEVIDLVDYVHVKDARGGEEPVYTLPGAGDCRVAECLSLLLSAGFTGTWSIEPHLQTRPHEGVGAGPDGVARFVEYGRRLEHLVEELATVRGGP
ncbi:MAG: sugar phosphate isomerase/epimerase family protein [Streptosporangiaceae bacterium]